MFEWDVEELVEKDEPLAVRRLLVKYSEKYPTYDAFHALRIAVELGHHACADVLICHGTFFSICSSESNLVLRAVREGNALLVTYLVKGGACDEGELYEAYAEAARKGMIDMLNVFHSCDLSLNCSDGFGMTPLFAAATAGQTECVEWLLEKGASLSLSENVIESNALYAAATSGNPACVKLLCDRLAPEERADVLDSALFEAIDHDQHANLAVLWVYGANIEVMDENGRTPLIMAAALGSPNCIKMLVELGAKRKTRDHDGRNALSWAGSLRKPDSLAVLLQYKCEDVESRDNTGVTALEYAAQAKNSGGISLLLNHGAKVDGAGVSAQTPLMRAVKVGCVESAKLLVDAGAKVDANVLRHAKADAHRFIADILLKNRMRLLRGVVRYLIVIVRYREDFYCNKYPALGAKSFVENLRKLGSQDTKLNTAASA